MTTKPSCDCHLHARQVCDTCQDITGNERDVTVPAAAPLPLEERLRNLRERAKWYRAGCDGLEDREGYWQSGDVLRDVGDDLDAALELFAVALPTLRLQVENQRHGGAMSETRRERAQKYVRKSTQDSVGGLIEFAAAEVKRDRQALAAQVQALSPSHGEPCSFDHDYCRALSNVLALLAQEPED